MKLVIRNPEEKFFDNIESYEIDLSGISELPSEYAPVPLPLKFLYLLLANYHLNPQKTIRQLFNETEAELFEYVNPLSRTDKSRIEDGEKLNPDPRREMERVSFRNRCYESLRRFILCNPHIFKITYKPGTMPDSWEKKFITINGDPIYDRG
jgi:hypothetical protein